MNGLILEPVSGCDSFFFSKFNVTVTAYWEHLSSVFLRFIIVFFSIYPIWIINI